MKKTIVEIYALAVCFATVVCFVISLGIGIYDIVEITNPEFTLSSWEYKKHQSNDAFWYDNCKDDNKGVRPQEEELTKTREESLQNALKAERRDAFQGIVSVLIIISINVLVFLIHWAIAKRSRENTG
jgi:hypothetical protein